jgi:hypothetical protein
MIDKDLEEKARALMMSPAISKAGGILTRMSIDVNDEEELKTALSTIGVCLSQALDNNEIIFKSVESEAMLYCLLGITISQVLDGNKFQEATVQ